jgi:hypothetical protein
MIDELSDTPPGVSARSVPDRHTAKRVVDMHENKTAASGYKGVEKAFHEAVEDRYEPFQKFKWQGKLVTSVADEDGDNIDVETPKGGSMEMEISFFWEDDTDEATEKDVEKAVHHALKDLYVELGDRDQDHVYGEIPRSFFADNPEEEFASDWAQVYATPNGRAKILKLKARGAFGRGGRMEFGVDVLIQVGLEIVVESM